MNITFLVGNGFDLACGLKSQYKDVYTEYNYKGQYTQRQSPLLSQGVSGYTQNRINGLEGGYTPGSAVQQAQAYLNQVQSRRPGEYQSQWDGELTELYNRIANRKPFSYDIGTDPVYQQYREQYQRQGRLAMQDTMGQAAALADAAYGSCIQAVERYQMTVMAKSRNILNVCDAAQTAETDPDLREKLRERANGEIAAMLREETDSVLKKVLDEASARMKNAFSRADN